MLASKSIYSSRGIQWCICKNPKIMQSHTHAIMDNFFCNGQVAHVRVTVRLRDFRIFLDALLNTVDNFTHQNHVFIDSILALSGQNGTCFCYFLIACCQDIYRCTIEFLDSNRYQQTPTSCIQPSQIRFQLFQLEIVHDCVTF